MTKKKKYFYFIFYSISIVIFGISIPTVSYLAILVCFFHVFIKWNRRVINDFVVQSYLLLMFCVFYYSIVYYYEFMDLKRVIGLVLIIPSAYAFGYSLSKSNTPKWPYGLVVILITLVTGFVSISFLSVYQVVSHTVGFMHVPSRVAESIWSNEEGQSKVLFDGYASLGMCLGPLLLFGRDKVMKKRFSFLLLLPIAILFMLGTFANIGLEFRTPIFALIFAFLFCFIVFFVKERSIKKKLTSTFILICLVLSSMMIYMSASFDFSELHVLNRLSKGIETSRYNAWMNLIENFDTSLLGGRKAFIGDLEQVHNLWLDIIYDAGILPLFPLLLFYAYHIKSFFVIIKSQLPFILIAFILCIGVSFFFTFMKQPTLVGSRLFFIASCFFLGVVRRLSNDVKLSSRGSLT